MTVEQKAREFYDQIVSALIESEKEADGLHKKYLEAFSIKIEGHPGVKGWIYAKTLEWVNEVRVNEMGLDPTQELVAGNELDSNHCTIAATLDTLYATAVGDNDINLYDELGNLDSYVSVEGIPSAEMGKWYCSWCRLDDPHNEIYQGWAKLPWYAWMVANAFDYGGFPELKL
jgi:hypothetical protein